MEITLTAGLPERIELPAVRAALRRHTAADIDALHAAVEESRDHLRPHMPWADGSRADLDEFVTDAIAQWDAGRDRNYLIVESTTHGTPGGTAAEGTTGDATAERVLGGCGLHTRLGDDALEIGYWLRVGETGRGLMTAAARALTDEAMALDGITRVEIHCDEANVRSAAVPRRLGYSLARIVPDGISAPGDVGRSMIWVWPSRSRVRRSAHDPSASST